MFFFFPLLGGEQANKRKKKSQSQRFFAPFFLASNSTINIDLQIYMQNGIFANSILVSQQRKKKKTKTPGPRNRIETEIRRGGKTKNEKQTPNCFQ